LLTSAYGVDLSFVFLVSFNAKHEASKKALGLITSYRATEATLSSRYAQEAVRRIDLPHVESQWREAESKFWFLASLARKRVAKSLATTGGVSSLPDVANDLPKLASMHEALVALDALQFEMQGMPGWNALSTDTAKLSSALDLGSNIRASLVALAKSPEHLIELRKAAGALLVDGNEMLGSEGSLANTASHLKTTFEQFNDALAKFAALSGSEIDPHADLDTLHATCRAVIAHEKQLKGWCDWCRVREEAVALGLGPIVELAETDAAAGDRATDVLEAAYARWFASGAIDAEPLLRSFVAAEHASEIEAYRRLEDYVAKLSVRYIRARLSGLLPDKNDVPKSGGYGVLKHELQKSRRHKPVRQLASEMGDAMAKLAPCMLMSPLSIAQYLPADQALFDLVIFDEASQIAPWDAIGSIARGKQVVIAGDPRQMPPTSFFARAAGAGDEDTEEDMESILDECLGAGIRSHRLTWHYRSRHESLIAFSNHQYYDSELITFPAAETRASAVEWRRVEGVYAKGKGRNNQREAEAIVAETVRRLTDPAFVASGQSIGIITLNSEQQKLVNDLLDVARQRHPEIERHFQQELPEPVVVKNLETVQGDERDLIILGIAYGPTDPGANVMSMNFGPLNREGGWRRLNVAVTRARREMIVFTSFDPSMIDLNRTSARAVADLKHFIEFAQRGPRALAEAVRGSVGGFESPLEEYVAEGLRAKGWQVVPQIGVSRFRIDLGIVHPDRPGDYLVGVECDGATYHSAATARDRDQVRSGILQGLGWKLLRVWSTEWWVDKEGALGRLHVAIVDVLMKSRDEAEAAASKASETLEALDVATEQAFDAAALEPVAEARAPEEGDDASVASESAVSVSEEKIAAQALYAAAAVHSAAPRKAIYTMADIATLALTLKPDDFYVSGYDNTLRALIHAVLECEAPMLDTLLVQRIARFHGFQRAGRLIRERVLDLAAQHHHFVPDGADGTFVWLGADDVPVWNMYREPTGVADGRSIEEIAMQELHSAARAAKGDDRIGEVAKMFGVRRVGAQSRLRIERACADVATQAASHAINGATD
jgi:very-short-patch-repair endonuclease